MSLLSVGAVKDVMTKHGCDEDYVRKHVELLQDQFYEDNRILLAQTAFGWKVRMFTSELVEKFEDIEDIKDDVYIVDEYNVILDVNDFTMKLMHHKANYKNSQVNMGDTEDKYGLMWKEVYHDNSKG